MSRVLVIGLGAIGRRHVRNVAELDPDGQIVVLRRSDMPDDLIAEVGARVVTELHEVIAEDFDLVILATPSSNHIDLLPSLIERGWPLLIEKPVVSEVADCDRIADAIAAAPPAERYAGFNLRYLPSLQQLRQELSSGAIGTVVRATLLAGQWLPDWRPDTDYRTVYSADEARGGGVELDLSHEFDMVRWLFGDVDIVGARGGNFSELELAANDTSVALLAGEGAGSPLVTVAVDYIARQRVRWYEIVGDRARCVWDLDGSLLRMDSTGQHVVDDRPSSFDVGETYRSMLRAVLGLDPGHVPQPLEDGLASTRLALGVRDWGRK